MYVTKDELLEEGYDEGAIDAFIELFGEDELGKFVNVYQGRYDNDEEFARELLERTEQSVFSFPYIQIDWEATTAEVMNDYSEANGYYFKDLY